MPENAEIYIISQQLDDYLRNLDLILPIEINKMYSNSTKFKNILSFSKELNNSKLIKVNSKGKTLIFNFEDYWITFNIGFGKFNKNETENTMLCLNFGEKKIYLDDKLDYFRVEFFLKEDELNAKINKIGVDILKDVIENDQNVGKELLKNWNNSFDNKRIGSRLICKHLVEQKYFSGIGNYLKSEILFCSGISPYRKVKDINKKEREILLLNARKIIKESYECNGFTLESYSDINGEIGHYIPKIYGKNIVEGKKVIITKSIDNRVTYWCPDLQN